MIFKKPIITTLDIKKPPGKQENSESEILSAGIGRAQKGGMREVVPLEEEGAMYEENHQGRVHWCQEWKASNGEGWVHSTPSRREVLDWLEGGIYWQEE